MKNIQLLPQGWSIVSTLVTGALLGIGYTIGQWALGFVPALLAGASAASRAAGAG